MRSTPLSLAGDRWGNTLIGAYQWSIWWEGWQQIKALNHSKRWSINGLRVTVKQLATCKAYCAICQGNKMMKVCFLCDLRDLYCLRSHLSLAPQRQRESYPLIGNRLRQRLHPTVRQRGSIHMHYQMLCSARIMVYLGLSEGSIHADYSPCVETDLILCHCYALWVCNQSCF